MPVVPDSLAGQAANGDFPAADLYKGYETWKGWDRLFTVTAEDSSYFSGEARDLAIKGAEVLEIGFGSGSFLAWAKQQGARVAGIEINETAIAAAQKFGVELLPANFETVASQYQARFDTIAAFDVFEHFTIDEIVARLKATEVMLKPSGQLVLRFPNAQSPFGLAPQFGDLTHKTALCRSAFEQLIQESSFTVARYGGSYRIRDGTLPKRVGRAVRTATQQLIAQALTAIYARSIPWDPVVVLVLRKDR